MSNSTFLSTVPVHMRAEVHTNRRLTLLKIRIKCNNNSINSMMTLYEFLTNWFLNVFYILLISLLVILAYKSLKVVVDNLKGKNRKNNNNCL